MYEFFLQVEDVKKWKLARLKSANRNISTRSRSNKEVETGTIEGNEEIIIRFTRDLVDERIKASLEPLHAQISALTEMIDYLIQSNSARETTTAGCREIQHQYESPYPGVPRSSRFTTAAPLTTAGYSPDTTIIK